jgi:hypothetical protein
MDRCEQAACLLCVFSPFSSWISDIRSDHDSDRVLATLRSCVESALVHREG